MLGPDSSYSSLEIHICWKVEREARMDPPIQTEYFLSGIAITLTFDEVAEGASFWTSLVMWITKSEYDESGAQIVHRKCF